MFKGKLKNPIFLFYLLIAYVFIQFSWWLYLIFSLYGKLYTEPKMLTKKTYMLLGEGFVFLLIFILGIIVIRRAIKRDRELNKQQENFLLSVSHELKTPISSIQLFLQTLKKRDLSPDKRDEIYHHSLGEVNRLDNLVGNLLLTRNISNDNYFLNKVDLDLNSLIKELVENYKLTSFKSHEIELKLEEVKAHLDKEAFESILLNLIGNAIKYSPKGSKISILLKEKKDKIFLSISDEGEGIEDSLKKKVFTKFFRVENELTRKSKGTGLGLYITKQLIERHGGQIKLTDNKPSGLRIEITL